MGDAFFFSPYVRQASIDVATASPQVFFWKRAQILAADLAGARVRAFKDLGRLTMFADYRVPQILRAEGVLLYSAGLERKVDEKQELPQGQEEEVEIRAATVQAVERLRAAVEDKGVAGITSVHLDWLLWQIGERTKDDLGPHHRTLTVFY
jgi:hypothetical protein